MTKFTVSLAKLKIVIRPHALMLNDSATGVCLNNKTAHSWLLPREAVDLWLCLLSLFYVAAKLYCYIAGVYPTTARPFTG